MVYKTKGVCAQEIQFEMDADHKIHNVQFFGGCSGNTQGVSALVEGMDADEVISRPGRDQMWFQKHFMS